MTKPAAYILCTAPRSGSTLLCRMLGATGLAGAPDSYFHGPIPRDWAEGMGVDPGTYPTDDALLKQVFAAALAEGCGETGMFGLRQQAHSLDPFCAALARFRPKAATDRARIEAVFGRTAFIHLRRADKVAQAVSWVRAEQSGLWHAAPDGTELERLSPPRVPEYDADLLRARVACLQGYEARWAEWFAAEGIAPLRLSYEELAADPRGVLAQVLGWLGCDPAAAQQVSPGTKRLADAKSAAWVARFRSETAARGGS